MAGPQFEAVESEPPTDAQNPELYNRVVLALGVVSVLVVLGLIFLSATGKGISDGLVAIGAAAVGGLVTLLAPRAK